LDVCKHLIGREDVLAGICRVEDKSPFAWARPSKYRDAGDFPSARHMRQLLAHSDTHRLGLTARHLIEGAQLAEIEAILAARAPVQDHDGPAREVA
jgi:hypothetical protein